MLNGKNIKVFSLKMKIQGETLAEGRERVKGKQKEWNGKLEFNLIFVSRIR